MLTLKADKRDLNTKAKALRREGYVVGNVFGKRLDTPIAIKIDSKEASKFIRSSSKGTQVNLEIENEAFDVLVKEISFNPVKNQIENIDFQELVKGDVIASTAQVVLINHDKLQGHLNQLLFEISYKALPKDLIESVEIDIATLGNDASVKVSDLSIASNDKISISTALDDLVLTISEHVKEDAYELASDEKDAEKEAEKEIAAQE